MAPKLLESDIAKFRRLYYERFGVQLSTEETRVKLGLLVRQVQIAYRPIRKEEELKGTRNDIE